MKYLILLLPLIFFPITSSRGLGQIPSEEPFRRACRENPVVMNEMEYKDYLIKISSAGDQACRTLDILKNGELVYHDEEIGGYFYLGDDSDEGEDSEPLLDLPDRQDANLVISKWTGGAHCCYSLFVFELGHDFKIVAHIDGGNFQPYLEDINHDGIPEIKITDDFLAYRFSSFAFSATADVMLEYRNGIFNVMADYMKKTAPDFHSLNRKISSWQEEFRQTDAGDYPPPEFVQTVTELFYTGNKGLAMDMINWAWPTDIPGKIDFIKNYEDALKESRFYKEFERQL